MWIFSILFLVANPLYGLQVSVTGIVLENVMCDGTESNLQGCTSSGIGNVDGIECGAAGVECVKGNSSILQSSII